MASVRNTWDIIGKKAKTGELPRLYFCIGEDDFLYEGYLKFKAYAEEIGLDAKFESEPGYKHEWRFWDLEIQRALDFFGIEKFDPVNFWDLKKDKK